MNDDPFEQNMKRLVHRHQRVAMSPELRAELLRMVARASAQRRNVFRRTWPLWVAAAAGILVAVILSIPREDVHREGSQPAVQDGQAPEKEKKPEEQQIACQPCIQNFGKEDIKHSAGATRGHFVGGKCQSCGKGNECLDYEPDPLRAQYCSDCAKKLNLCAICGAKMAPEKQDREIKIQDEWVGETSRYSSNDHCRVINQQYWKILWMLCYPEKGAEIPNVDFSKEMVIGIFLSHSTQRVFHIRVARVMETDGGLELNCEIREEIKIGQSDTTSFFMVKLPATSKKIRIIRNSDQAVLHEFLPIRAKEIVEEEAKFVALEHIMKQWSSDHVWGVTQIESKDSFWWVHVEDTGDPATVGKRGATVLVDKKTGDAYLESYWTEIE